MSKTTRISLGDPFECFIDQQFARERYRSASDVISAGLRLLEERVHKLAGLRKALLDGERTGDVGDLDMPTINSKVHRIKNSDS